MKPETHIKAKDIIHLVLVSIIGFTFGRFVPHKVSIPILVFAMALVNYELLISGQAAGN